MSEQEPIPDHSTVLKTRARELAKTIRKTTKSADLKILEFIIFGKPFACEIKYIREVLRNTYPITPLPGLPSLYLGIVSIRGEIIPVIDIAAFLELKGSKQEAKSLMVLQKDKKTVAFPCDRIERVRDIARKELQAQVAAQSNTVANASIGCGEGGLVVLNAATLIDDPRLTVLQE
ncbi:MAG: chemotaxis protein CheW [Rectinema sp.]|nr:chemotaxis protein CheW [Rectinema sp.]